MPAPGLDWGPGATPRAGTCLVVAAMTEAILLGDITVDVLLAAPSFPTPGGDVVAREVLFRAGGSASNTAIVLAKLGVPASLVGCTGGDPWADRVLQELASSGLDLSSVRRDASAPTGLIFILRTPDGERTMVSFRGANTRTSPDDLPGGAFPHARLLHLSGYSLLASPQREAAWRAVSLALEHDLTITLDVGLAPAQGCRDDLDRLLPHLDLVVLGLREARDWFGGVAPQTICDRLLDKGARRVALKLGPQGCRLADADGWVDLPGFDVQPVDTTGAGDAFCAGLLYAHRRGLGLAPGGVLANALGALATLALGAGPALPGLAEARAFLASQSQGTGPLRGWVAEALAGLY